MVDKPIVETIMSVRAFEDACIRGIREFCISKSIVIQRKDFDSCNNSLGSLRQCWEKYGRHIVIDVMHREDFQGIDKITKLFSDYYFNPDESLADFAITSVQFILDNVPTYKQWIRVVVGLPVIIHNINRLREQGKDDDAIIDFIKTTPWSGKVF